MNQPTDFTKTDEVPVPEADTAAASMPEAAAVSAPRRGRGRFEKPKKKHRALRILLIILCVLLGLLIALLLTYVILRNTGKESMLGVYDNVVIDLPQQSGEVLALNDGKAVEYQGHHYQLNESIATILFMGIDTRQFAEDGQVGKSGQADCVLLIAVDTKSGKTQVVNISREAYAEVDLFSGSNQLIGSKKMQLCLAYAYGDGKELSCERTVNTVSRLLYNMPIGAYVALDMSGINAANDLVGGVTLTSLSTITLEDGSTLLPGEEITLLGDNAERYIRSRDTVSLDSNLERMERQKQYVQAFAAIVTKQAKKDLSVPVNLFNALSPYMVSDLDVADVTFLSTCYIENGALLDFSSINGTVDKLNGSAVYYLDETDVYETVLDVFYTQTD